MITSIVDRDITYYSLTDLKQLFGIANSKRLKQSVTAASNRDLINRNKVNYADIDGISCIIARAKFRGTPESAKVANDLEQFLGIEVSE